MCAATNGLWPCPIQFAIFRERATLRGIIAAIARTGARPNQQGYDGSSSASGLCHSGDCAGNSGSGDRRVEPNRDAAAYIGATKLKSEAAL
jgi:hypothetical protein